MSQQFTYCRALFFSSFVRQFFHLFFLFSLCLTEQYNTTDTHTHMYTIRHSIQGKINESSIRGSLESWLWLPVQFDFQFARPKECCNLARFGIFFSRSNASPDSATHTQHTDIFLCTGTRSMCTKCRQKCVKNEIGYMERPLNTQRGIINCIKQIIFVLIIYKPNFQRSNNFLFRVVSIRFLLLLPFGNWVKLRCIDRMVIAITIAIDRDIHSFSRSIKVRAWLVRPF